MTVKEAVGQVILMGFPGPVLTERAREIIREKKIGNIILFAHNIESAEQLAKLTKDIKDTVLEATGHLPFIGIDQEGGVVTRLSEDIPQIPGAMAIASTGDEKAAYDAGYMTGEQLALLGINLDFAPDMDINSNSKNPVIGVRSFGENAETVIKYSLAEARGLKDAHVAACGKHFPGHGDTDVDSHLGLPTVNKTIEELEALELKPFAAAVRDDIPFIMTTHIVFPKLDGSLPATMSRPILTGLLKGKLGFKGVVVTDCLEMGAIKANYGTPNGAVEAIKAGADMVCISHDSELAVEAAELIEEKTLSGEIPEADLFASAEKILKMKEQFPLAEPDLKTLREKIPGYRSFTDGLRDRTITVVANPKKRPLKLISEAGDVLILGCQAYRSTLASSEPFPYSFAKEVGEALSLDYETTPLRPSAEDIERIVEKVKGYRRVVLGTYNAHILTEQTELMKALDKAVDDLIFVALRNPYDLNIESDAVKLAAYEYTRPIFGSLIRLFSTGERE